MSCVVREWAQRTPDEPALLFEGRRWSFAELDREIAGWVGWLSAQKVGPQDRVSLLAWNRPETVAMLFAVRRLGATLVLHNARLTSAELLPQLELVEPRLALAEESLAHLLPDAQVLEQAEPRPASSTTLPEAPAPWVLLFTSGTTGRPKAVELGAENLWASARASGQNLGADAEQRWLGSLPLFHVGGLAMAVRCAGYGATLVLERRFTLDGVARAIAEGATHVSLVPQTLRRLLEATSGPLGPRLRAVLIGGGPSGPELLALARARGLPVLQTYGLTEACSQVATERPGAADGTTAGFPLPQLQVRIRGPAGERLEPGEEGEIQVRGPTVMRGYFRNPEATSAVLRDGWLHTGDLGALDEAGRLKVLARRTDLILSGGENIYPAELEATLQAHPAIDEVAITAAADPTWGQLPVAVWVGKGAGADDEALIAWARERLAGYKVPRRWIRVAELPRNANGKVDRQALRKLAGGDATR